MACGMRDDLKQPKVTGADELLSRQVKVGSFWCLEDGEGDRRINSGPVALNGVEIGRLDAGSACRAPGSSCVAARRDPKA